MMDIQIMPANHHRQAFIDNLRASLFVLLAFDHVIHAYAAYFGRFHFFKDFNRTWICDAFYLFDNSIIMPLLFFITGMFVLPVIQKKGLSAYSKNRFLKWIVPYIIGIPFIVPFLVYPRYCHEQDPTCSFTDFWQNIYFAEKIQGGGPFWVLFCWTLYTFILVALVKLIPPLQDLLRRFMQCLLRHPMISIASIIVFSMAVLTLSDYRWGAPWWIGLPPLTGQDQPLFEIINTITGLFHLQGSRFIIHALYFILGAMISLIDVSKQQDMWLKLAQRWPIWLVSMIIIGTVYIGFTINYANEGAYSAEIYRYFYNNGTWLDAWPVIKEYGGAITIRTCLHGAFIFFQIATLLSVFYIRYNYTNKFWCNLTNCTYGIFLLHEVPVIWLQYKLSDVNLPIFIKVIGIFLIGVGGTWLLVSILRKIPGVKKII